MASSAKHFTTKKKACLLTAQSFCPQLFNLASVYLIFCFSESFFFLIWLCPKLTCPKGQNCDLYTVGFYLKNLNVSTIFHLSQISCVNEAVKSASVILETTCQHLALD